MQVICASILLGSLDSLSNGAFQTNHQKEDYAKDAEWQQWDRRSNGYDAWEVGGASCGSTLLHSPFSSVTEQSSSTYTAIHDGHLLLWVCDPQGQVSYVQPYQDGRGPLLIPLNNNRRPPLLVAETSSSVSSELTGVILASSPSKGRQEIRSVSSDLNAILQPKDLQEITSVVSELTAVEANKSS